MRSDREILEQIDRGIRDLREQAFVTNAFLGVIVELLSPPPPPAPATVVFQPGLTIID